MKKIIRSFKSAFLCLIIMTIICGVIYPGIITGIAQVVFPEKSCGSIITVTLKDGTQKDYGSALIAQEFIRPEYLIGRPMGSTNLSPISEEQKKLVQKRIDWLNSIDQENKADIPMDLVTSSGSGVDPDISPEAAEYQVQRIARERSVNENNVRKIIKKYTTNRFWRFWGEPAVNVLKVNLALDGLI